MQFKEFMKVMTEMKSEIKGLVRSLDGDELDDFGDWIFLEYLNISSDEFNEESHDASEIINIISSLDKEDQEYILSTLEDKTMELSENNETLDEAVSRILKNGNKNKKKRKFFGKSKSELRRTGAQRKKKNRSNKASRKAYYRANKSKIKSYAKSYRKNVSSGKHKVKIRKSA